MKNVFEQKSFNSIKMSNIFEAFYLTLVKSNSQIESAGKGAVTGKNRAVIGWKRINERASFMYNLKVENKFFLLAEGEVKSFDKSDFISRQIEERKVSQKIDF